jgi:hypothetical protein
MARGIWDHSDGKLWLLTYHDGNIRAKEKAWSLKREAHATKNYLAHNISSADTEKACCEVSAN